MPGPSNLYGVANPVALPISAVAFGPVACPSGTETTLASIGPIIAPSAGYFYPMVWLTSTMLLGATVPTSVNFFIKIGGGSDQGNFYIVPSANVASSYTWPSGCLLGAPSNAAWAGLGSVLNITINPTGQAVTCYNINYTVALFRAPDQ